MKIKTITTACLSLLLLSACQKNFIEDDSLSDLDERVPLGIQTTTASITKAILTPGVQTTKNMKVGLFATGSDYFASGKNDVATFEYSPNSWTMKGPGIYLTAKVATLYGFYPHDAVLTKHATDPEIEVKMLESGVIKSITNNAADNSPVFNHDSTEVDYMAFLPQGTTGRVVNNGKADGTTPEANKENTGSNPGPKLNTLSLAHGMAMVSFRLYNDSTFKGPAKWTRFELGNVGTKKVLKKGTGSKMNLANANISIGTSEVGVTIARDINAIYTVPVLGKGGSIDALKNTANKLSCLVFPIASIVAGDLHVKLTIDGTVYTVGIPAGSWVKGKNHIYGLKLSGAGLSLGSVEVISWGVTQGGDIPVN